MNMKTVICIYAVEFKDGFHIKDMILIVQFVRTLFTHKLFVLVKFNHTLD